MTRFEGESFKNAVDR